MQLLCISGVREVGAPPLPPFLPPAGRGTETLDELVLTPQMRTSKGPLGRTLAFESCPGVKIPGNPLDLLLMLYEKTRFCHRKGIPPVTLAEARLRGTCLCIVPTHCAGWCFLSSERQLYLVAFSPITWTKSKPSSTPSGPLLPESLL